jgi:HD-GYP domain-containing protein (c-di-GMP phosphodiesterase class II)
VAWDDIPDWAERVANSLLQTVREKDPHTFLHCCRVGRGSRQLGKAMGLNDYEQSMLEFSGLFHDIGKVGIPDSILLKPGRLDAGEIDLMKAHPIKSAAIIEPLADNAFMRFLLPGIRYHHERIDGTGYPFGLAGDRIPLPAKVIAVVDSFDAMTNVRPYRKPLSRDKVLKELYDFSGRQFDTHLVKIFLEILPHMEKQKPDRLDQDEIVIHKILKAA